MTNSKNLRRSDCTQSMYILPVVALMLMLLFVCTSPAKGANGKYISADTAVKVVKVKGHAKGVINYKEKVYNHVKKMPSFPGGKAKLMEYLHSNLVYPQKASEERIMGGVLLQFVVRKSGNITNVCVLRSISPEIDAEAVRLVESMPKWIPGEKSGVPVNVKYILRVDFILNK